MIAGPCHSQARVLSGQPEATAVQWLRLGREPRRSMAFRGKMVAGRRKPGDAIPPPRDESWSFCHAWIKSKLGLRQFHVRGLK